VENRRDPRTSEVGPLTGADGRVDRAAVGQSCLGQRDVRMTPLLGALIAAGIANDGRQLRPYVVQTKRDHGGRQVFQAESADLRRSVPSDAAVKLAAVMAADAARAGGQLLSAAAAG
jgi:peptidoglycan glycosyltransferase